MEVTGNINIDLLKESESPQKHYIEMVKELNSHQNGSDDQKLDHGNGPYNTKQPSKSHFYRCTSIQSH